MIAQCPKCGDEVRFRADDGRAACRQCGTRLRLPPAPVDAGPFDFDAPPPVAVPDGQPLFVPVPVPTESPDYVREKVADLRDRRDDRRERREYDREDRVSNPVGIAGFAMTGTALLLVLSGGLFATQLKAYSWFAAVLGLGITLAGLPLSLVGALRPGRARAFAVAGAAMGGLLLLALIPALMMYLTSGK